MTTRRELLAGAAALPFASLGWGAASPDLIVKGGRVMDASQGIDRVMDVAVTAGKISALGVDLPAGTAKIIDARGKIVTPGLVDIHAHPRPNDITPAKILSTGVTTVGDGGSRGWVGIKEMTDIARAAPNRMRIFINISKIGNISAGELLDFTNVEVLATLKAARENREWIVGVKARLSQPLAGNNDLEAVRKAHEVTKPLGIPLMIHIGDTVSELPKILEIMRPGDIVTHVYAPPPHGILDANGKILPEVRAARKRGVLFDIGNGMNGHITWEVAEKGLAQDFPPDTISSDLTQAGLTDRTFDLPTILSKFLLLGMPLAKVIDCATSAAARSVPGFRGLGTLKKGVTADITVLELVDGQFDFVDNVNAKRVGKQKIFTRAVVFAGKQVV